jgi:NAD(P)-dependent dehydrogenase (short-subunit alcohol dehydrogenase family)
MKKMFVALAMLVLLPLGAHAALSPGSPTVLITGANRGIGFELAKQYSERGWNVIATTRRPVDDKGVGELRALADKHPQLVIERIDVTDTAMIRAVAAKYANQPLDVLVNNAANVEQTLAADVERLNLTYDKIDFDAARNDFDVNTLGPMRMVQAFMPAIERSKQKKIVNVTSLAGSFGRGMPGAMGMNYGASKAALNKYSVLLSKGVQDKGVIVALVQPIFVASKSDMKTNERAAPVEQEVAKLIKLIDGMTLAHSGKITNFQTGETDPF